MSTIRVSLLWKGIILVLGCFILQLKFKRNNVDTKQCFHDWMLSNDFTQNSVNIFKEKGIDEFPQLYDVCGSHHDIWESAERRDLLLLDKICIVQTQHILLQWLSVHGLHQYSDVLKDCQERTVSATLICLQESSSLTVVQQTSTSDFKHFKNVIEKGFKADILLLLKAWNQNMCESSAGFFYSIFSVLLYVLALLLVGLFVADLRNVILVWKTISDYLQAVWVVVEQLSKKLFLRVVHAKKLSRDNYQLEWNWTEPQKVGGSFQFLLSVFTVSGSPYYLSSDDQLDIFIRFLDSNVPVSIEGQGGLLTDKSTNKVRVQWTVHRAGSYIISVSLQGKQLAHSPFIKEFLCGPVSALHSSLVYSSSLMVCSTHTEFKLTLQLRDAFNNSCVGENLYLTDKLSLTLTPLENKELQTMKPSLQIHRDLMCQHNHTVRFFPPNSGIYDGILSWEGETLSNGQFQLLVLEYAHYAALSRKLLKKSGEKTFEAYLMTGTELDNKAKGKRVYCLVTQRQLTIKEYYMKLIPRRLSSFRVCNFTKFDFCGHDNYHKKPSLTITDGFQQPVTVALADRDLLVAAFALHLMRNMGGAQTFKDKQEFFYREISSLHDNKSRSKLSLKIDRHSILSDSYKETKMLSLSEWCRTFDITFVGEEGLDYGGLRREWLELLCIQIFDPEKSGLFMRFKTDAQGLVHPNPNRPAHLKSRYYEMAGKIVGKCLFETSQGFLCAHMVKARFTRSFLAQLIGIRVTYKHFEQDDPDLFTTKIKYILENEVSDLDMTFAEEEFSDGQLVKVVDLIPNGKNISVTEENKFQYLDALAQYRLVDRVKSEIEAFLKGLCVLVPDKLLAIFDENELELLMCGSSEISVADLQRHHTLLQSSHPGFTTIIHWFWTIVSGFTNEEMARLLQFVTGSSQLPPGGFKELSPQIQIGPSGSYGRLPQAHTCFNHLLLPHYDDMESMHKALLIAITEGNQGFGLV